MANNANYEVLSNFIEGMRGDFDQHAENKGSYEFGLNGRLYSHNGVVSFSSIRGTKEVFRNEGIIKYLGYYAFEDELILFLKCKPSFAIIDEEDSFDIKYQEVFNIFSMPFSVESDTNSISINEFEHIEQSYQKPDFSSQINTFFNTPLSCVSSTGQKIKMDDYFKEILSDDFQLCEIDFSNQTPNSDGNIDCIVSLKKNDIGDISANIVWAGYMNWNVNAKIVTHGIEENNYYKRVYFTDYINPLRVVNLKDSNVKNRQASEFETFQNNMLLQPIVKSVNVGDGYLPSGTMMYCYRLITKNGSQSEFSPISEPVLIYPDSDKFRGGEMSEKTNKSVIVTCNIAGYEKYESVECIALEYEANGSPTAIRQLGIKKTDEVVEFQHNGGEPEFAGTLTLSDILVRKNTWKYCSSIVSKRNKLIAVGLRNEPLPSIFIDMSQDFTLKGWDENGNTHNCLINPKPDVYKYFPVNLKDDLIISSKKIINRIESITSFNLVLRNDKNGHQYSKNFISNETIFYRDFTREVYRWLEEIEAGDDFALKFPNVKISLYQGKILFERIDEAVKTNFIDISLTSNNSQMIIDSENNTEFLNVVNNENLVRGYISNGYSKGNGIRITFTSEREKVLTSYKKGKKAIINKENPSLKKSFMKGEIYRLGIQFFDKNGSSLFVVPIGDVQIPEIGEKKIEIDELGNIIVSDEKYANSVVIGDEMFAERILMNVDVRLSCQTQKVVSMYQIVYVKRDTNENRTIVAQGLSAPLQRIVDYTKFQFQSGTQSDYSTRTYGVPENIRSKWTIPNSGFPLYDFAGVSSDVDRDVKHPTVLSDSDYFTINGRSVRGEEYGILSRVIINRSMVYFDSPDFMYNRLGKTDLDGTNLEIVAHLDAIREGSINNVTYGYGQGQAQVIVNGDKNNPYNGLYTSAYENTPTDIFIDIKDQYSYQADPQSDFSYPAKREALMSFGVFVFREYDVKSKNNTNVLKYAILNDGEVASTARMDTLFAISNNATSFLNFNKFYSLSWRTNRTERHEFGYDESYMTMIENTSASTVFIKTNEDLFTKDIYSESIRNNMRTDFHRGNYGFGYCTTLALVNIKSNSVDSVYGGRDEYAMSKNKYYPLSRTIPVLNSTNNVQRSVIRGDVYTTLFAWMKTRPNPLDTGKVRINIFKQLSTRYKRAEGELVEWQRRGSGAYYAFVVETMVEPQLVSGKTIGRQEMPFSVSEMDSTLINEAYFQDNDLKTYIPKPFNFNDDPDMSSTIAVSDVKLNGDYKDAWTEFRVNNFYELDRNKGSIYNIVNSLDNIYAIQEHQTSLLMIDENVMMQSDKGDISVQQGNGEGVSNHKIVSDYGTSIRRAVVNIISNSKTLSGFTFFDEKRYEWVKVEQPVFIEKDLHLKMREIFRDDKIIDSEGWFDDEYKETNIRLRTQSGKTYTISFNEKFLSFNGYYDYDNDIYMIWNNNVYSPDLNNPDSLHQFNIGDYLKLYQDDKSMKIRVTININPETVKIFKHWAGIINIKYPIEKLTIKTNLGQERVIEGTHYWYKIREGRHSVPLKNEMDWEDLRGEWATIEAEIKSVDNKKIDVFSFINFVRHSYQ